MNYGYFPMQTYNHMPTAQSGGLNWCQGESGAKAWYVPAGQTVLLMDSEEQKFYIKQTDANGMPMPLRVFTYTEARAHVQTDTSVYATKEELNELKSMIEKMSEVKHEPVVSDAGRK